MKHRYSTYSLTIDQGPGKVLKLELVLEEEQGKCKEVVHTRKLVSVVWSEHKLNLDTEISLAIFSSFFLKKKNS